TLDERLVSQRRDARRDRRARERERERRAEDGVAALSPRLRVGVCAKEFVRAQSGARESPRRDEARLAPGGRRPQRIAEGPGGEKLRRLGSGRGLGGDDEAVAFYGRRLPGFIEPHGAVVD